MSVLVTAYTMNLDTTELREFTASAATPQEAITTIKDEALELGPYLPLAIMVEDIGTVQ